MNRSFNIKKSAVAIAVIGSLGLGGCFHDGDAPAAKSSVVSGVITGFGSVFVDGVEYETNDASVTVDGVATSGDDSLKLGMYVTLEGVVNPDGSTGVAKAIKFNDDVEGVVTNVTVNADGTTTLVVMGQTVTVDGNTIFESKVAGQLTIANVQVGNIVEISGHSSGMGTILATRVEVKKSAFATGDEMEVKGVLSALDPTGKTFKVGSLTVVYTDTTVFDDMTLDSSAEGLFVEVKSDQNLNSLGQMVATKVELENGGKKGADFGDSDDDSRELKIEGLITAALANGSLAVNGQTILVSNTVKVERGALADLSVGSKVKVEVKLDANGNLVAKEIELARQPSTEIKGYVTAKDVANNTVSVMGQTITITNQTLKSDNDDRSVRYFGVDDITVGDWVEVYVYQDATGKLVALKLERESDTQQNAEIEGKIQTVNADGSIVVAGITVDVSSAPQGAYAVGTEVEIRGQFLNGKLVAVSVEIESSGSDDNGDDHS